VEPDDGTQRHVPDSTAAFTVTQARDLFFALDWHPSDHPPLPDIVAHGRKPDVMACGVCHQADGPGGPENASIAGLPAQYIVQQMADFKSGVRTTSVPQRIPGATDDQDGEGHYRCRNLSGGRLFFRIDAAGKR
jgi:cytochrome c553